MLAWEVTDVGGGEGRIHQRLPLVKHMLDQRLNELSSQAMVVQVAKIDVADFLHEHLL